jgi:asparagine synthase (glutamine-hydrolysing)
MCGITGVFQPRHTRRHDWTVVSDMAAPIRHRGPDDSGAWIDSDVGIGLAHRRLSIIDLSEAGRQPMVSGTGRYVIVFNGEIYNYRELRRELTRIAEPRWRGHSDTEVLLAGFELWGVDRTLTRTNGMFAFAVWDRRDHALRLARDRIGEKPLYYGWLNDTFAFGSDLACLQVHPDWDGSIDRSALMLYMRYGYVPSPYSIFKRVQKLPAGTLLELTATEATNGQTPRLIQYWSAADIASAGQRDPLSEPSHVLADRLDDLLRTAVQLRMEADVPLGAFLSGGIDSSTVVALMQAQTGVPIRTFTVGFTESSYNEAPHARQLASALGTDHTELIVSPAQAREVIPLLPAMYGEPFADSSQIPTYLVSRLARQHVTVALSGDGGDELFGGYNRYLWGQRLLDAPLSPTVRSALGSLLRLLSPRQWNTLIGALRQVIRTRGVVSHPGDSIHKLADSLGTTDAASLYAHLTSVWQRPQDLVLCGDGHYLAPAARASAIDSAGPVELMMYMDLVTYLPDDILVKLDRASMYVSLEARVPMLDHNVVEFAWRLPMSAKLHHGRGKWLLRQVLHRYVPERLAAGPKSGFGVPLDSWLRSPLRDWAEELLREDRLRSDGFLDSRAVQNVWSEHLSGRHNRQHQLWNVLMFQAWLTSNPRAVTQ